MPLRIVVALTQWMPLAIAPLIGCLILANRAGGEIIRVGYENNDLPQLSETEQATLDVLLSTQVPYVISSVSPDGHSVVVGVTGRVNPDQWQVKFLDLRTGELESSEALDAEVFSPELPIRWLNNDVVQFLQSGQFGPWEIVTINRNTGIASRTSVYPTNLEEGEILGIAPDFSKFVVRVYEDGEDVIYMVFLPSLNRVEAARLPDGTEIQPPAWSDNGEQVVLVTTSIEERDLYERTPLSPNLADPVIQDALGRLAPEDNILRDRNEVRVFDFSQPGNPLRFELRAKDTNGEFFANADVSPDGRTLLVKIYEPGQLLGREHPSYLFPEAAYYRLYDLDGNLIRMVKDPVLDGPLENQGRFVDADTLVFTATLGLNRHIYRYELTSGSLEPLPLPPGSVNMDALELTPNGDSLIYTFSSVTQPPEVFKVSLDNESPPQQLTHINQEVANHNRVQAQVVRFETRNGPREGLLIQPQGAASPPQNAPLVLWQQGGPGFSMTNEFAVETEMPLNLLPNFGISILSAPLAGREGYGPEFYRLQAHEDNFGQVDLLEGVDIVSQLISWEWTTARQIGITGCSYGGYYASQAIARFQGVFAAANPQCALLDAFTEWQLGYSSLLSYLTGTTPMENPEQYRYLSPLYSASQIRTPTMMFHGSDDFLQIDVARNFHDVIAAEGVPVTLYEFEGTGHAIFDPNFQRIAAQLQIDFFRQHLVH